MAAVAAAFRHFDAEEEEWELYREQLEQFFVSNGIKDELKKAVLINHLVENLQAAQRSVHSKPAQG